MNDKELLKEILGLSDSVYIPNDTKDYTGVKIMVDVNSIAALVARREAQAVHDAMWRLRAKQTEAERFSLDMQVVGVGYIIQELSALTTEATQSGKEEQ